MHQTATVERPATGEGQLCCGTITLYDREKRLLAVVSFRDDDPEQALHAAFGAYRGSNPRSGTVRDDHGELLTVGQRS